jgi:hypothetical protein
MGTRADFYIGKGKKAEWLGSIAWDGYPKGIPTVLLKQTSAKGFRANVTKFLASRDDSILPEQGWPWPWEDSCITDYAYAFEHGKVSTSSFGSKWFDPLKEQPENLPKTTIFPNMKDVQKVDFGKRSGIIIISAGRE